MAIVGALQPVSRSGEALAGILGHARLQLAPQLVVVEVLADQHNLVLAGRIRPVGVVDREALAGQVKHMPPLTFVEPQDPLGPEDFRGQLVVEEVLEFAQGKGALGRE